jgi:hypothetical protein
MFFSNLLITKHTEPAIVVSDVLKRLYRDLAKLVHPDLTSDDAERRRRTAMMTEANRAYAAGDEAKLRRLLDDWVSSPDLIQGEGVAVELVRAIRKIHQVERRLADIEVEVARLKSTETYGLKLMVEQAASAGRDLLKVMANDLKTEIAAMRTRIDVV